MARSDVDILLKATDAASKNIALINKGLKEMTGESDKAADAQKKLDAELKKAEARSKAMADTSFKLAAGFGAVAAAGGLVLGSSIQLAARVETLGVVTARLGENVGMTEEEIRSLEEAIQDQGITTQASRQIIAKMIQSQIDLADATDIARLAQNAAVIANINSSEAAERVTNIIATGSVIMARTIGLTVDFQGAYEDLAETLGVTADELSDVERVQARTAEVMEAGTRIAHAYEAAMDTAGKKVNSLDRHLEESSKILGEMWLPIYADAVDAITNSLKTWQNLDESQQDAASTALVYVTAISAAEAATFLFIGTAIKARAALAGLSTTTLAVLGPVGLIVGAMAALGVAGVESKKRLDEATESLEATREEALDASETYEDYRRAIEDAAEELGLLIDAEGRWIERSRTGARRVVIDETFIMSDAMFETVQAAKAADRAMIASADVMEAKLSPALEKVTKSYQTAGTEAAIVAMQLDQATRAAEASALGISDLTAATVTGEGWFQKYEQSVEDVAAAARDAEPKAKSLLDTIDRQIPSAISGLIDDLQWLIATGGQFDTIFGKIREASDEAISPEEKIKLLGDLFAATQDVAAEMGEITGEEAAQNISDTLGISLEEAKALIDGTDSIMSAMAALTAIEWQVNVRINTIGGFDIPGVTLPPILGPEIPDRPPEPGDPDYIPPGEDTPPTPSTRRPPGAAGFTAGTTISNGPFFVTIVAPSGVNGVQFGQDFMAGISEQATQDFRGGIGFAGE